MVVPYAAAIGIIRCGFHVFLDVAFAFRRFGEFTLEDEGYDEVEYLIADGELGLGDDGPAHGIG